MCFSGFMYVNYACYIIINEEIDVLLFQVMEVVNGDALVVKTSEGQYQKIFFSSLRAPRSVRTLIYLLELFTIMCVWFKCYYQYIKCVIYYYCD